jgi:hypothetical protein
MIHLILYSNFFIKNEEMFGQLSNYMKNFNIGYINPYVSTVGKLLGSLGTAYSIFTNLNKLDDLKETQKNKAVDISKAVTAAVTGFIPNLVIGPVANAVIDC